MKYLVEISFLMVRSWLFSLGSKGSLIKTLIKMTIAGIFFLGITWLLFGEAVHPKMLLLLPIYILTGQGG